MRAPTQQTPAAFSGPWRITETELWDIEAPDTVQPAFSEFVAERGERGAPIGRSTRGASPTSAPVR
jgi:hypothetical protein